MVKNLLAMQETWVGEIPWRRKRQPTPVFLLRVFYGQRSLVGYSPCGIKEWDMTEQATHECMQCSWGKLEHILVN